MKFIKLILFCLIIFCTQAVAQRDNIWMLGYGNSIISKPSIDFSSGSADTFSFSRPIQYFITNSSICDNNGNLLFSTNGHYIENSSGDTLLNSDNFNPGWLTDNGTSFGLGICQGAITIPFPDDSSKYITFHVSANPHDYQLPGDTIWYPSMQPFHLGYSVIDMNLDSGNGGIINNQKNIHAVDDTLFQGWITACKHGNGRDWWILVHKWYSDLFYKFLITPQGVSSPIAQNSGPIMLPSDGIRDFDVNGQACFSPDGSKYAMAGQSNNVDLFDFDRCTGFLSNHRSTHIDSLESVRGCAFSPNSQYLYVSSLLKIFQFDTWQPNLDSARILVAEFDSFVDPTPTYFYMWQLAPDGKLYGNTWGGSKHLHTISNPDSLGLLSNVMQHSLAITNYSHCGFNFPNFNLGPLNGSSCDTLTNLSPEINYNLLQLSVSPSPVSGSIINIKYNLQNNKSGEIKIFDDKGRLLFKQLLPQWSSIQQLNLPQLSNGIFLIVLQSGGNQIVQRFVKIQQ